MGDTLYFNVEGSKVVDWWRRVNGVWWQYQPDGTLAALDAPKPEANSWSYRRSAAE